MTLMNMLEIVQNVDLNVSGIAWHPQTHFIEVIPNAVSFCTRKIFKVLPSNLGYSFNTELRIEKLVKNDWLQIT